MKSIDDIFHPELNDIFEKTKTPRDGRLPLSRQMAEFLLGESLDDVVLYDLVNGCANRRSYNTHLIVGMGNINGFVPHFKELCSQSSVLMGRVPVAVAAKTYSQHRSLDYHRRGLDVAGNVIFYDAQSRKYSAFTRGWMHCDSHYCNVAASEQALYDVMNAVTRRFKMVESFAYQKPGK